MKLGCEWKQEVVSEGSEEGELRKGGELQQNKGWKWDVGTGKGGSAKDQEGLF